MYIFNINMLNGFKSRILSALSVLLMLVMAGNAIADEKLTLRFEGRSKSSNVTLVPDPIVGVYEDEWSDWADVNEYYECGVYVPAAANVDKDVKFTQSTTCSVDQHRERNIYELYRSGKKKYLSTESENKTISVTDSQDAVGEKYVASTSTQNTYADDPDYSSSQQCKINGNGSYTYYAVYKYIKITSYSNGTSSSSVTYGNKTEMYTVTESTCWDYYNWY